jgi:hypothetical protein
MSALERLATRGKTCAMGHRMGPFATMTGVALHNRIALHKRPEDLILNPFADAGFTVLSQPQFLWREVTRASISRNTFNNFHFVTESLCQLCLVEETGLQGRIFLHYPNSDGKTRPFSKRFIAALFPELAHRVGFRRSPVQNDRVVAAYNFQRSLYQTTSADISWIAAGRHHVGLSLAIADCHEHFGVHYQRLSLQHAAYRLDPKSWQILISIVWRAKSINQTDTLRAALLALKDGLPDRFAAFAKDRPWAHRHVADTKRNQAS